MRITNSMLSDSFLADMQVNLNNLSKIQQQMSSMKNFSKPSDDPFNVVRAMQLQTDINTNDQYKANITTSLNFMNTTDTALKQIGDVLGNIRDNLVKSGDAAYGTDERSKIADEVNQRVAQLAQQLNTSFQGEYIFAGTKGLSKPVMTNTYDIIHADGTVYEGAISIAYADKSGVKLANQDVPVVATTSVTLSNWNGKSIDFSWSADGTIDGTIDLTSISPESDPTSVDDLVKRINDRIQGNTSLRDKIIAAKTSDGNIKFLTVNSGDNITITSAIDDLSAVSGNQLSSVEMDNLSSKRKMEVSQGVVVEYNATVPEILNYGSGPDENTAALLDRIVHHLNGQIEQKDSDGNILRDASGNVIYDDDVSAANDALIGQDITDIDQAAKQAIKVRSQIGAKSNRMESLSDQNDDTKINMTDVLSKTEDIDITQKTIEYYTMTTVYQACLQTSARVMQPTLMDYIS